MLRMYEPSVTLLGNSVYQELNVIVRFMRNTDFNTLRTGDADLRF